MRLALALTLCLLALPAFAQQPKQIRADQLRDAAGSAEIMREADKAASAVDTASIISIVVAKEGSASGSIAALPTDPEWATAVKLVKDIAAKRKARAESDLSALGLAVTPEATPAAPR